MELSQPRYFVAVAEQPYSERPRHAQIAQIPVVCGLLGLAVELPLLDPAERAP